MCGAHKHTLYIYMHIHTYIRTYGAYRALILGMMLCNAVVSCTLSCYPVLCCAVLYSTVQCCIMYCSAMLCATE